MNLTLEQRCEAYARTFPQWPPPRVSGHRIEGIWMIGNNYRSTSSLYGAYPPTYLDRVLSMFPDVEERHVLHVFSGSLPPGEYTRVDIQGTPDCLCSAEELSAAEALAGKRWDLILADPPYSKEDAKRYGCKMPVRRKVTAECAKIIAPGGWLVWLDTVWPMYRKAEWILRGHIAAIRSTNNRVRLVTMLERRMA